MGMKRSRLGSLDVTSIGLGSAPLGGLFTPVSDADAEATIASAWSLGIRFFDTAPLYGFGLAERRGVEEADSERPGTGDRRLRIGVADGGEQAAERGGTEAE